MGLNNCKLVSLISINDKRGNMGVLEAKQHIPFEIKRIFYIYHVNQGETRGAHAHKAQHQFLIPFGSGFDVTLDDGKKIEKFELNNPTQGLYIAPMVWAKVENFKADSVCLVLTSAPYDENDYHRDYETFLQASLAYPQ